MADQKDGHRYTLSIAHQDLPAILIALREAANLHDDNMLPTTDRASIMREIRIDLIKQRDDQPWVAFGQPGREEV